MSDMSDDIYRAADRAVFHTEDPEKIKERFAKAFDAWQKERSTLGGYLRDIRFLRELSPPECALKVGVSRAKWQAWESNRETPTEEELDSICRGMVFGKEKRETLNGLKEQAQRHRLLMLSELSPEFLAARGVAKLEASLEWQKLSADLQNALIVWGESAGMKSAEEILGFPPTLKSDEDREEWVDTILGYLHDLG